MASIEGTFLHSKQTDAVLTAKRIRAVLVQVYAPANMARYVYDVDKASMDAAVDDYIKANWKVTEAKVRCTAHETVFSEVPRPLHTLSGVKRTRVMQGTWCVQPT